MICQFHFYDECRLRNFFQIYRCLPFVISFYCSYSDTWYINIYWSSNSITTQQYQKQHMLVAFNLPNLILRWVSPPYICYDLSFLNLCYIIVLFLFWYVQLISIKASTTPKHLTAGNKSAKVSMLLIFNFKVILRLY